MKIRRALIAGLLASLAAIAVAGATWLLLRADPVLRAATPRAVLPELTAPAFALLLIAVLAGGVATAVLYAAVFELVTRRSGIWLGIGIAALQAATVWLGIGVLVRYVPPLDERLASAAFALFNSPVAITGFIAAHLAYGAVIGARYGAPRHDAASGPAVTWRELFPSRSD